MSDIKRFGKTDAEKEAELSLICRQIVREIFSFGVSQAQLVKIIKLLALELEDRTLMNKIVAAVQPEGVTADDKVEMLPKQSKILR